MNKQRRFGAIYRCLYKSTAIINKQKVAKTGSLAKQSATKRLKIGTIALIGSGFIGLACVGGAAFAENSSHGDGLAQRLASKFNLNKDEVSKEIESYRDDQHKAHDAEMKQKFDEKLQKQVEAGKLTAEQKSALEAKMDELHKKTQEAIDSLRGQDDARQKIKEARDSEKRELESWAKSQGLDLQQILPPADRNAHDGRGYMMDRPDESTREGEDAN